MDPYLLGMWLGDGLSSGIGFALNYKTDFETLAYWEKWAENNGGLEFLINTSKKSFDIIYNWIQKKPGLNS